MWRVGEQKDIIKQTGKEGGCCIHSSRAETCVILSPYCVQSAGVEDPSHSWSFIPFLKSSQHQNF
jgi:hypothetical protein